VSTSLASMSVRPLTRDDACEVAPFVLMAAFPPGAEPPPDALEQQHARRWLEGWGDELGVAWEENGVLGGVAWARRVMPILVRDDATGDALPEVIISVAEEIRGSGVGRRLMEALVARAQSAGVPGLSLSVSERNPVAVRLYESVGFVRHGRSPTGSLTMAWRPIS
jgi:GNAT superfamily N-acetyltransferase